MTTAHRGAWSQAAARVSTSPANPHRICRPGGRPNDLDDVIVRTMPSTERAPEVAQASGKVP